METAATIAANENLSTDQTNNVRNIASMHFVGK